MKSAIFGLTLITFILFYLPTNAQSVRKKGWIVLNSGDTLHRWLNYRNWEKNPSVISFSKDSLTEDFSKYSKHDLQSIYINGLDYYKKAIVKKDARPVKLPDLLPADVDSLVVDTVLLRSLVLGTDYELYELVDEKDHFFIASPDKAIIELTYKVIAVDAGFVEQKIFTQQLKALLHGANVSADLLKKIDGARYRGKDLSEIVNQMNEMSGTVHYKAPSASRKISYSFFVGAGGGYSSLRFSGTSLFLEKMNFSGSFVPFASAGIDIASLRNLQALVFRAEVSLNKASYTGKSRQTITFGNPELYDTQYEVAQTTISSSLALLYNFIRKESFRMYFGAGATYNTSFYSKNMYTRSHPTQGTKQSDNYLDLPRGWISLSGKLGVKFHKNWEAGFNGQFTGTFTNYVLWGLTPLTFSGQVRYFF